MLSKEGEFEVGEIDLSVEKLIVSCDEFSGARDVNVLQSAPQRGALFRMGRKCAMFE